MSGDSKIPVLYLLTIVALVEKRDEIIKKSTPQYILF
jgi:hypothetical protein